VNWGKALSWAGIVEENEEKTSAFERKVSIYSGSGRGAEKSQNQGKRLGRKQGTPGYSRYTVTKGIRSSPATRVPERKLSDRVLQQSRSGKGKEVLRCWSTLIQNVGKPKGILIGGGGEKRGGAPALKFSRKFPVGRHVEWWRLSAKSQRGSRGRLGDFGQKRFLSLEKERVYLVLGTAYQAVRAILPSRKKRNQIRGGK